MIDRNLIHIHVIADAPAYMNIRGRLKPGVHYGFYSLGKSSVSGMKESIAEILEHGLETDRVPAGLIRGLIKNTSAGYCGLNVQGHRDLLYEKGINPIYTRGYQSYLFGAMFIDWNGARQHMADPVIDSRRPWVEPIRNFLRYQ